MMKRILVSMVCITLVFTLLCLAGQAAAQKDTLVVGGPGVFQYLDPARCYTASGWTVLLNVYEGLVAFPEGDQTRIVPQLATSWEVAEDRRTWTFFLHEEATFASGNPVTADAVIFSLNRFVKFDQGPSWMLTQFGITEDAITKIDDKTVRIVLAAPYAPNLFLSCLTSLFILDPEVVMMHELDGDLGHKWLNSHSAGSGPYILEEHQPETHVVLRANNDYWGATPPVFERLTLKLIGDPAEQAALLQTGEIDIAQTLTGDDIQTLKNDLNVQIFQMYNASFVLLLMNMGFEPFASPEVRDAIRYAIDYDGLIEYVVGVAATKQPGFIPKGFLGYTPDIPYSRDVDKARALLAKGGYPEGFTVEFKCWDLSGSLELAMKVREDLAQVGIQVQVMPGSRQLLSDAFERGDFQMSFWWWWNDYADTDGNAKVFAHCYDTSGDADGNACLGVAARTVGYTNPETSKLVEQAAQEFDVEKRRALYEQINAIIVDDGPFVFLYSPISYYAIRTEIIQSLGAPEYRNEFMIWK